MQDNPNTEAEQVKTLCELKQAYFIRILTKKNFSLGILIVFLAQI